MVFHQVKRIELNICSSTRVYSIQYTSGTSQVYNTYFFSSTIHGVIYIYTYSIGSCTQYTVQYTLYSVWCTVSNVPLWNVLSSGSLQYIVFCKFHIVNCIIYDANCTYNKCWIQCPRRTVYRVTAVPFTIYSVWQLYSYTTYSIKCTMYSYNVLCP